MTTMSGRGGEESSDAGTTTDIVIDPEDVRNRISRMAESMARGLTRRGYWTNYDDDGDDYEVEDKGDCHLLSRTVIETMRRQAIALRFDDDRFVQSYSECVDSHTGIITRFDKPGVYACEPDGSDYRTAPDMLHYVSTMLRTLPNALNDEIPHLGLRDDVYSAKLAVTGGGGCKYPRHVDNVSPPTGAFYGGSDYRKLTAILYLNPDWREGDGGELRLYLKDRDDNDCVGGKGGTRGVTVVDGSKAVDIERYVDLSPVGGRMVLFWSDEVPHEVLENAPHVHVDVNEDDDDHDRIGRGSSFDRYALTIWVPSDDVSLTRSFVAPP